MRYIKRELERKFLKCSDNFKAVLVTGARQVGKTTMLKELSKGQQRKYVTLDNASTRELAMTDPHLFFQTFEPPIILDEIQKAPQLFEEIKIICDNTKKTGLFWITGSEQYSMMKNVSESLAGRIAILKMLPLSQREICGKLFEEPIKFDLKSLQLRNADFEKNNISSIFNYIWTGGMPAAQKMDFETREEYFNSYVETYLMRDAIDAGGISDTIKFSKFVTACAALTSTQVNFAKLADICEITQPTAKSWLNILVGLGVVHLLQPYSNNSIKRLSKTPKLYFSDTGLCANLTRWLTPVNLMEGALSGAIFENYVVNELLKGFAYSNEKCNMTYFRSSNETEIDILIEQSNMIHPVEIKQSSNPDVKRYIKAKEMLSQYCNLGNGGIVCMTDEIYPLSMSDFLVPCNIL